MKKLLLASAAIAALALSACEQSAETAGDETAADDPVVAASDDGAPGDVETASAPDGEEAASAGDEGEELAAADDADELASAAAAADDPNAAFDAMLQEMTIAVFSRSPIFATYLGLPEEMAGGPYLARLDATGVAADVDDRAFVREGLERLEAVDESELDDERALTLSVLRSQLGASVAASDLVEYGQGGAGGVTVYPVTQLSGPHIDLPNLMQAQQPVTDAGQAEAYVARLHGFADVFDGTIEVMRRDAELGVIPPDFVIDGALEIVNGFTETPVEENILVTSFSQKLDEAEIEDAATHLDAARDAVENSVYPAYERLADALTELRADAVHDAGIGRLPNGEALYNSLIRIQADTNLSAQEIHDIGLAEVARIHDEMDVIFSSMGMTEGSIQERLQAFGEDEEYLYPNTDEGRAELLADLNAQMDHVQTLLPEYFATIPPQPVEIRRVPEFSEASAPGGYYSPASLDGSRPGVYWINLRDTAIWPSWSLPTLTYHEAVPGHHFQISIGLGQDQLPLLRRLLSGTNAFTEGWALYAERLAWEMGLYEDDPAGDIGRLRDELHRAIRLVTDTGMHALGWTREEAIEYMFQNEGLEMSEVVVEIERYAVWPGQALGYKMGQLEILRLREEAREALGEDFDLREFHDVLLLDGGLPLPVLEQRVQDWVASQQEG